MLWWQNIPAFCILFCMLAAIVSSVLGKKASRYFCIVVSSLCTLASLLLLVNVIKTGEEFVYYMGHFPAPWGNEIRAGVLEALMASFFCAVMLLSLLGGMTHIQQDLEGTKHNLYFVMINLVLGALQALVYTNDLFTAYVFIEITTIASGGILMIRQTGHTTLAAVRYMIMSLLGSGLILIGIALTYNLTGHLLMSNIHQTAAQLVADGKYAIPLQVTMTLMSTGLAVKAGLFPFHFWMPDTYGYATPASGSVLSGLISKGYIFLLIKLMYRVIGLDYVASSHIFQILFLFGLLGIIFGSISAIREDDIRRMTAYSSAAQIGYIFVGIGLGTTAGMVSAVFHMLTHAVTKPLLFIAASALSDVSGGSKKFADLQGAGFRNRIAGIGFSVGALSMVGIPVLAGFSSKLMFGLAAVHVPDKIFVTLVVLAISTVLNAVYFLRTVIRLYRPSSEEHKHEKPCRGTQLRLGISVVCFILLNILLGLFSSPISEMIETGLNMFA